MKRIEGVDQVEDVLEGKRVVHGATLELPAVLENLLGNLTFKDFHSLLKPAARFMTLEKQAGEDQRLCICEKVVPQQVVLKVLPEPSDLERQALDHRFVTLCAAYGPLDPTYNA